MKQKVKISAIGLNPYCIGTVIERAIANATASKDAKCLNPYCIGTVIERIKQFKIK